MVQSSSFVTRTLAPCGQSGTVCAVPIHEVVSKYQGVPAGVAAASDAMSESNGWYAQKKTPQLM